MPSHTGRRRLAGAMFVMAGCSPAPNDFPRLPERSVPPDVATLPAGFASVGGPVFLRLTGWADSAVVQELEAAGLLPLPGYKRVERLDSIGMNVVGGTVPPQRLDPILAVLYVRAVEPATMGVP